MAACAWVAGSNITVADLTIWRARTHPIHVTSQPGQHTLNTMLYNIRLIDPGQQALKINAHAGKDTFPDQGTLACSYLELTDAGRPKIWEINGSCYTGGLDAHEAEG